MAERKQKEIKDNGSEDKDDNYAISFKPKDIEYISNPYADVKAKKENQKQRDQKRQARDKRIHDALASYPKEYFVYRDLCKQIAGAYGRKLNAFWHDAILIEDDEHDKDSDTDEEPTEKRQAVEAKKEEEKKTEKLSEFEKNLELALSIGRQNNLEIHGMREGLTALRDIVGRGVKNAAAFTKRRRGSVPELDQPPKPEEKYGPAPDRTYVRAERHERQDDRHVDRPLQAVSNFHPSFQGQAVDQATGHRLWVNEDETIVSGNFTAAEAVLRNLRPLKTLGFYQYNNNVPLTSVQRDHAAFLNGMNEIKGDRLEPVVYEMVEEALSILRESKNLKTKNLRMKELLGNPDYRSKFVQLLRAVGTQNKHTTSTTWIRPQAMYGNNAKLQQVTAWFDNLI